MPCWYFERKEIRDSPSFKQGIDQATENRYRREGARLILDAGTKLGLRYDTCATGVVYFHRFYTTHSFREFHRYVMSACCLFLAGKVEETPKKCRDIIRTVQTLLKEDVFNAAFGEDPREEVMTTERILLQTVKFDLQVEHPYHFLLAYAKQIKGDKDKIQKMAQMSWTFINDSLCTTLCLQWEPEIIAVSLMYLASRLTKFEPTDWTGRISGSRSKWWEDLIEGMTMELMEDICHQVLDLYSAQQQAQKQEGRELSPPLAAGPRPAVQTPGPRDTPPPPPRDPPPPPKRARNQTSPGEALVAGNKVKKVKQERDESSTSSKHNTPSSSTAISSKPSSPSTKAGPSTGGQVSVASVNPYVSSSMYSSSFMSQEGQQSIASLLGGNSATPLPPAPQAQPYPTYPPPSTPSQYHVPPPGPYTPGSYPPPPAPGQYHTPPPYSVSYSAPPYGQSTPSTYSSAPPPSTATPSSAYPLPPPAPYSAPPPNLPPPPHPGPGYPYPPPIGQPPPHIPPPGFGAPPPGNYGAPPPPIPPHRGGRGNRLNQSNLAPVRCISDRGGLR